MATSFGALLDFNPLTPCGVRLRPSSVANHRFHFNPLTPCGVRLGEKPLFGHHSGFQSTHPMRGETTTGRITPLAYTFQSTHPMRGETAFMPQISSAHKCICTKPAPEFSVSCAPPAKIHLIAVLIVQKSGANRPGNPWSLPLREIMPSNLAPAYDSFLLYTNNFLHGKSRKLIHRFRHFFLRLGHRDIFLGEARLLRQLDVSRSLDLVEAKPHKVLHGHGIRGLL